MTPHGQLEGGRKSIPFPVLQRQMEPCRQNSHCFHSNTFPAIAMATGAWEDGPGTRGVSEPSWYQHVEWGRGQGPKGCWAVGHPGLWQKKEGISPHPLRLPHERTLRVSCLFSLPLLTCCRRRKEARLLELASRLPPRLAASFGNPETGPPSPLP